LDYFPAAPLACSLKANLVFDGQGAAIESLQLEDGPLSIDFGGTIDFADLRNVVITLHADEPLLDLGWLSRGDCITAVQFLPAPKSDQTLPQIEQIEFQGNVLRKRWRVALTNDVGAMQKWPLCANQNGRWLNIAVVDQASLDFGQSALRTFRNGAERKPSLWFDRP
jgi:hypothetical protein